MPGERDEPKEARTVPGKVDVQGTRLRGGSEEVPLAQKPRER
jgi:hypothetical protein